MDYTKYTINSEDLTEGQSEIICNFDLKSGVRSLKKDSYKSVDVGFHLGKCFHVSFNV